MPRIANLLFKYWDLSGLIDVISVLKARGLSNPRDDIQRIHRFRAQIPNL